MFGGFRVVMGPSGGVSENLHITPPISQVVSETAFSLWKPALLVDKFYLTKKIDKIPLYRLW
jgi:hypothetical protein